MMPLLRLLFIFLLSGALVLSWCYFRPLPLPVQAELSAHEHLSSPDQRTIEHVTLHTLSIGDIGLTLSMPSQEPQEKMPIIMVLGGLGTGANNIRAITNAGNNIVVGYDWPMTVNPPKNFGFLLEVPKFYKGAMIAPAQIAAAIDWLSVQPFADPNRISILGYSMGALAAPAAQRLTEDSGHKVNWTILAYGGAPLGAIFTADKHIQPDIMRALLAPLINIVFHPLQPEMYLPTLTGHFLILEGKNDGLIPESARTNLRQATLEPKTVIDFEGDHMGVGPDKQELLQKIIAASRAWLMRMNAVNPL